MQPGFKVNIGFANYSRMLLDADFRGPFVSIFVWTVLFAALTVLFSTALGMTLAVLLSGQRSSTARFTAPCCSCLMRYRVLFPFLSSRACSTRILARSTPS